VKLVSFGAARAELPGILLEDEGRIVPLAPLLRDLGVGESDMTPVLGVLPLLRSALESRAGRVVELELADVRLGPPVPRPSKIVVCGVNYASQVLEARATTGGIAPRHPPLGLKPPTALSGPYDAIVRPPEADELDHEAELAVVIGVAGRRISRDRALEHVAGYMCAQDLSAHDVMRGDTDLSPAYLQIVRGKSFDSFCPTGPWLLTADEVPDPGDLRIRCWLNDELRQDASTAEMIVDVPGLVEWVSSSMTLLPGDVLLTGTPAGMGIGSVPPRFLRDGDVLRTAITGLGEMRNEVRDEGR
jgi:2-keto-4-pentenoate hydratase/2-oxohepta-3-ene-1,7-dioic acid hydratase in catechol pathway